MAFDYESLDDGQRFVIYDYNFPREDEWTPTCWLKYQETAELFKDIKLNSNADNKPDKLKIVDRQENTETIYNVIK